MSEYEHDLRLECLKLAAGSGHSGVTVHVAQAFYDFVTGVNQTPRQIIDAALDQANVK